MTHVGSGFGAGGGGCGVGDGDGCGAGGCGFGVGDGVGVGEGSGVGAGVGDGAGAGSGGEGCVTGVTTGACVSDGPDGVVDDPHDAARHAKAARTAAIKSACFMTRRAEAKSAPNEIG